MASVFGDLSHNSLQRGVPKEQGHHEPAVRHYWKAGQGEPLLSISNRIEYILKEILLILHTGLGFWRKDVLLC